MGLGACLWEGSHSTYRVSLPAVDDFFPRNARHFRRMYSPQLEVLYIILLYTTRHLNRVGPERCSKRSESLLAASIELVDVHALHHKEVTATGLSSYSVTIVVRSTPGRPNIVCASVF